MFVCNLRPSICSSLLSSLLLLLSPHLSLAQDGEVALYLDPSCDQVSPLAPTVSLALSTCLVPLAAYGLAIKSYPPCPNGNASLIMYKDTSCSRNDYSPSTGSYSGFNQGNNCFWYFSTFTIPGVMFSCEDPATNPQATSTTTVTASAVAGVAPSSVAGSSNAPVTTETGAGSGGAASTSTSASGGSTPTDTNSAAEPSASSQGSSGLALSDKIAIGVGVGVGVPTVVIALLAWCFPRG